MQVRNRVALASATDFTLSSISPVININLRRSVDAKAEHDEDAGEGRDLHGELEHPLGQIAVDQVLAGVELEDGFNDNILALCSI